MYNLIRFTKLECQIIVLASKHSVLYLLTRDLRKNLFDLVLEALFLVNDFSTLSFVKFGLLYTHLHQVKMLIIFSTHFKLENSKRFMSL